jgi:hypothetical protein
VPNHTRHIGFDQVTALEQHEVFGRRRDPGTSVFELSWRALENGYLASKAAQLDGGRTSGDRPARDGDP